MKKFSLVTIMGIFVIFISGCDSPETSSISAEKYYKMSINLDIPSSVSNFQGEVGKSYPVFTSSAYFTYKAKPSYFEMLKEYKNYLQQNNLNRPIENINCYDKKFPTDNFSYWTSKEIDLKDKKCFQGVFYPYYHNLVWNPKTMEVDHFVGRALLENEVP